VTAAAAVLLAMAAVLAVLHYLEHRGAALHACNVGHHHWWTRQPPLFQALFMCGFWLGALAVGAFWILLPPLAVAVLALADLAGLAHLFRTWSPS
jgi:hypothetical protein